MYVYNTDINKSNPNKLLRSLAHGEVVQFDVVLSMEKQATNVTGLNDKPAQGSKYFLR